MISSHKEITNYISEVHSKRSEIRIAAKALEYFRNKYKNDVLFIINKKEEKKKKELKWHREAML